MKKNLILLLCGILTISIMGCGSTSQTTSSSNTTSSVAESTSSNDKQEKNSDILLDATKLNEYSLDDINKFVGKEPEKVNDYKYVYNSSTDEEVMFDDTDNKIIYFSYDLNDEDMVKRSDKDKLFKKFGIDLKGSSYSDAGGTMYMFQNINNFPGNISIFMNEKGLISNITFYPKGETAFNEFLTRIKNK